LDLNDDQIKDVTAQIKKLADVRTQSIEDVDLLLKQHHRRTSVDVDAAIQLGVTEN
jgi:homocitrate synthase